MYLTQEMTTTILLFSHGSIFISIAWKQNNNAMTVAAYVEVEKCIFMDITYCVSSVDHALPLVL